MLASRSRELVSGGSVSLWLVHHAGSTHKAICAQFSLGLQHLHGGVSRQQSTKPWRYRAALVHTGESLRMITPAPIPGWWLRRKGLFSGASFAFRICFDTVWLCSGLWTPRKGRLDACSGRPCEFGLVGCNTAQSGQWRLACWVGGPPSNRAERMDRGFMGSWIRGCVERATKVQKPPARPPVCVSPKS